MKKSILIKIATLLLSMALVAGIFTFLIIPGVRREEQEKYEKNLLSYTSNLVSVPVYNGETPLTSGTVMTDALSGLFRYVKIPSAYLDSETVTDLNVTLGLQISGTLSKGEFLSYGNLEKADFTRNEGERLTDITVTNTVCGILREGAYIDVLVVYGNGDYDVVLSKKQVYKVTETGIPETSDIVLGCTESEYGNFAHAKQKGTTVIRVYYDSNDIPSAVTYGKAKN